MSGITQEWSHYSNEDSLNYNIRIFDFGQKMKIWGFGRPVESLPFDIGQSQFSIDIYPNGCSKGDIRNISVYVNNLNDWDVMVEAKISVGTLSLALNASQIDSNNGHGWDKFCSHKILWNFLDGGDLDISADIKLVWEYFPGRQTVDAEVQGLKAEVTDLKRKIETIERTMTLNLNRKIETLEQTMISNIKSLGNPAEMKPSSPSPCPECPICFDEMKPPTKIVQCMSGHLICLKCRERPEISSCPTCKKQFTGERAIGMENFLRTLFPD